VTTPPLAVPRIVVTRLHDGHRFAAACTLVAAMSVYGVGYRLRPVWGFDLPDGFHYLPDETPEDPDDLDPAVDGRPAKPPLACTDATPKGGVTC
jgi:hypothetical protein